MSADVLRLQPGTPDNALTEVIIMLFLLLSFPLDHTLRVTVPCILSITKITRNIIYHPHPTILTQ